MDLSIFRKAVSLGTTAALLASLAATVVAPAAALASTSVTSAGVVPVGGTSTTASSYQFCESAAGNWAAGGTITVTIAPASPAAGSVTFTNATGGAPSPTFSQNPGALGPATATAAGSTLTVTLAGDDGANALCFTVGNLYITAAAGTTTGAIVATVGGSIGTGSYTASTTSATGVLQTSQAATATTFSVNTTSSCPFVNVAAGPGPAGDFIINGTDTGAGGTAGALSGGLQTLTIAAAIGSATTAGQTVTQANVPNCSTALTSPGTVGNAVTQTAVTGSANPGENNQAVGTTTITETAAGYLAAGTVLTFAISAPAAGVTFSSSEWAIPTNGIDLGNGVNQAALCVLQIGAKSCTVTVKTASSTAGSVTLAGTSGGSGIRIDMASTVPNATAVNVTVTGSPAIIVNLSSNTIANASRVIVGTGAQPTIFINYNGQNSGMITLTEAGAGFFQGGSGPNDAFGICVNTNETFTYAPWAIVASGDLKLLNTSNSTAATQLAGTLGTANGKSCAFWSIYSASTVASSIDIVGATSSGPLAIGANNGPTLSVPGWLAPGTTQMDVLVGAQSDVNTDDSDALTTVVSNAVRVYKSGVTVTALSQPAIQQGSTGAPAGSIQIAETLAGQFKAGEDVCVVVLPRASNVFTHQDTMFTQATTNQLPVISTNYAQSGLLASTVGNPGGCANQTEINYFLGLGVALSQSNSFEFSVSQQAVNALGVITISNLAYTTTADAVNGPVIVSVFSECTDCGASSQVSFQANVSNAYIGSPAVMSVDSSLSASGPFTTATKVLKPGKSVTFRIRTNPQLAGKTLTVWIAKKGANGKWSAYAPHTSVVADVNGVAYYTYKTTSLVWLGFQFKYSTTAVSQPAVFARWMK